MRKQLDQEVVFGTRQFRRCEKLVRGKVRDSRRKSVVEEVAPGVRSSKADERIASLVYASKMVS